MSTKKERDTLLTVPNAAKKTSIAVRTLYYAIEQGFLKAEVIDGKPFVTLEAIAEWKANPDFHRPGPK